MKRERETSTSMTLLNQVCLHWAELDMTQLLPLASAIRLDNYIN